MDDRLVLVHRVETELRSKDISLNFCPVHNRNLCVGNVSGKQLLMQMTKIKINCPVKLSNCVALHDIV